MTLDTGVKVNKNSHELSAAIDQEFGTKGKHTFKIDKRTSLKTDLETPDKKLGFELTRKENDACHTAKLGYSGKVLP
jgi:hypothetical protein